MNISQKAYFWITQEINKYPAYSIYHFYRLSRMSLTPEDIQKLSTAIAGAVGKAMSTALTGDRNIRSKEEKTSEKSGKKQDFSSPKQLEEYIKKQAKASFSGIADNIDTIMDGFQKIYEQEIFSNKELDKALKNTIKSMTSMEDMMGSSGAALSKLAEDGDGIGEVFKILKKRVEGAATLQKELADAQASGTELSGWWLMELGKEMGVTTERLEELKSKGVVTLQEELIRIGGESKNVVKRLAENAVSHKRVIEGNKILTKGTEILGKQFGLTNLSVAAFAALGVTSFSKMYSAVTAGVNAQLPLNNILSITTDSLTKFGVPIEELTRAVSESRRQIAQTDYSTFIQGLDASSDRLRNEGVAAKDALELATAFRQNAQSAGISARDTDRMNAAVQNQEQEFIKLNRVTGMTKQEYIEMSRAAAENADLQKLNLGFGSKERAGRVEAFRAQSVLLQTTYGLSKAQADATQSALLSVQKDKVTSRLEQAAKVQQMASIMGMGDAGAEAADIIRLGRRATEEQKTKLATFMGTLNESAQSMAMGGMAEENVVNVLEDGMSGGTKQLYDAGVALQSATGKMITDAEAAAALQRSSTDQTTSKLIEAFTFVKNAFESPLVQMAISVAGLLTSSASLIGAASALTAAAGALSGGAIVGKAGKAGGLLAGAGKLAGGVMAAGAAGYAAGEVFNVGVEKLTGTSFGSWLYDKFGKSEAEKNILAPTPIPTYGNVSAPTTQQTAIAASAIAAPESFKAPVVATPTEINTVNQQGLNEKLVNQQAEMISILRASEELSREMVEILKVSNDHLKVTASKRTTEMFESRTTLSKTEFVSSALR